MELHKGGHPVCDHVPEDSICGMNGRNSTFLHLVENHIQPGIVADRSTLLRLDRCSPQMQIQVVDISGQV